MPTKSHNSPSNRRPLAGSVFTTTAMARHSFVFTDSIVRVVLGTEKALVVCKVLLRRPSFSQSPSSLSFPESAVAVFEVLRRFHLHILSSRSFYFSVGIGLSETPLSFSFRNQLELHCNRGRRMMQCIIHTARNSGLYRSVRKGPPGPTPCRS